MTNHEDQMLGQAVEDLLERIEIVRDLIERSEEEDVSLSKLVATLVKNLTNDPDMTKERLASILALALVKDYSLVLEEEKRSLDEFINKLRGE